MTCFCFNISNEQYPSTYVLLGTLYLSALVHCGTLDNRRHVKPTDGGQTVQLKLSSIYLSSPSLGSGTPVHYLRSIKLNKITRYIFFSGFNFNFTQNFTCVPQNLHGSTVQLFFNFVSITIVKRTPQYTIIQ